jgi:predicted TIM-barrel fold metal-dependent hydrolase
VGPALEAFGFERLVFGAGAAGADAPDAQPGEWFALALEAFAELGVEQDAIDAVFGGNARTLFGA